MDCAGFDAQVVRQDKAILAMADQFVFLRIVRMNGVDLNQFRFDYDLTWMSLFMDAHGRVYARYGGRDADSPESRLSRAGLLHAMNEALRIHREAKADQPPAPKPLPPRRPEDLRLLSRGRAGGCIHCHMVNEALNVQARSKDPVPRDLRRNSFFAYPLPENIGIKVDLVLGNRVREVVPQSPAEKAGLKKDDVLHTVQGLPVVTAFDIQYALNQVGADNCVVLEVERGGQKIPFCLDLSADWRRRDVSWRKSLQNAQPGLGFAGEDLSAPAKADLKVGPKGLGYHLLFVQPTGAMARAGLKSGDVIVAVDGKREIPYQHFRAYFMLEHDPGDQIALVYLRGGKEYNTTLTWR